MSFFQTQFNLTSHSSLMCKDRAQGTSESYNYLFQSITLYWVKSIYYPINKGEYGGQDVIWMARAIIMKHIKTN